MSYPLLRDQTSFLVNFYLHIDCKSYQFKFYHNNTFRPEFEIRRF